MDHGATVGRVTSSAAFQYFPRVRLEDLALIGNCQFSALVERSGAIVWCCLPRFDSEPIFSTLLDRRDGGHFTVSAAGDGLGRSQPLGEGRQGQVAEPVGRRWGRVTRQTMVAIEDRIRILLGL